MLAATCSGLIAYGIEVKCPKSRSAAGRAAPDRAHVSTSYESSWPCWMLKGIFTVLVGTAFFICFPN
ncbi:hypothetical protein LZ30DRAFT_741669 [Colletotrichum cereale]|nr:hypothetical protein LZ30DRAFT_741669 [Colletotrichum cereale]